MTPDAISLPDIVAEVTCQFHAYEAALMGNDIEALIGFFWAGVTGRILADDRGGA